MGALMNRWRTARWLYAAAALVLLSSPVRAEEPAQECRLEEPASDRRAFNVSTRMTVEGQVEFALGGGKSATHPLEVEAGIGYRERRLSGAGRDAQALRSLRAYDRPEARIKIGDRVNFSRLRSNRQTIVAAGRREGVLLYSPAGPMNALELELLEHPGDSLAALSLLPPSPVSIGEKWTPETWAIACLTRTEAVINSKLACELQSVKDGLARVTFSGQVEGAIQGAATNIELSGHYLYDLGGRYVSRLVLTQKEKRSVGTVSPGMDLTATVTVDRAPSPVSGPLTDALLESIPLDPDPDLLRLVLELAGEMQISYGRDWHVFHQTEQATVLRMIEKGNLISQCNISRIPAVAPGRHTPEEQFQGDIRIALGDQFKEIETAEELETADGRFLYRVSAVGDSNGEPMHWIYYLCAGPDGRQASFVFALETKLLEQLAGADEAIVRSLQFLKPTVTPATPRSADRTR